MAPEQILGRPVDRRTDVYGLGITLYELLSGYRPFNTRGKAEYLVLDAHVNDLPEPPTVYRFGIPQPIVDAVMRSLAKDPEARFQSAEDFMAALPDLTAPNAAAARVDTGGTVALEYSPAMSADPIATRAPGSTIMFEYGRSKRLDPHDSMSFDYSAATLRRESAPRQSAPTPAAATSRVLAVDVAAAGMPAAAGPSVNPTSSSVAPSRAARGWRWEVPGVMQLLRAQRVALVAVLVATLVIAALLRHAEWGHATPRGESLDSSDPPRAHLQASTATQTPPATPLAVASAEREPAAAPPPNETAATAMPPRVAVLATTTEPARQDLSGTWRGEYLDASGKPLLRVLSLSISRVHDDGGIEGTLQYQASSGDGECQLHPRGSTYSAGAQRLQLSPVGCSPHYPKELGVPLNFDSVNPQANTLEDGRIAAPTGEVIRVKLKRVGGV
jgi:serine/threonine-protein kinase